MNKYDIQAKFITTLDFPIIEAESEKEAMEKAELLLLTDKNIEESQDGLPAWDVAVC